MLSKQYHFQYEAIKALTTLQYESQRNPQPYVCIEGKEYPLWNTELLIDIFGHLKQQIKTELTKGSYSKVGENPEALLIIKGIVQEHFKELKIRLIGEEGYKEYFYFDPIEGNTVFDLTSIKKVNYGGKHPIRLHIIQYGDEEINLATLCPECWCGKWSRIKNF